MQNDINLIGLKINRTMTIYGIFALVVLAVIILSGLALFKPTGYRTVHQEVNQLADIIHTQYLKRLDFWGLDTNKLLQSGNLPPNLQHSGKLMSSLGREFIVGSNLNGDVVMPGGRQFVISIKNISRAVCIGLASDIQTVMANPAFEGVNVVNEKGIYEYSWNETTSLNSLAENAQVICRNKNDISWLFH